MSIFDANNESFRELTKIFAEQKQKEVEAEQSRQRMSLMIEEEGRQIWDQKQEKERREIENNALLRRSAEADTETTVQSKRANDIAEAALKESQESNRLAAGANEIAEKALQAAEEANRHSRGANDLAILAMLVVVICVLISILPSWLPFLISSFSR